MEFCAEVCAAAVAPGVKMGDAAVVAPDDEVAVVPGVEMGDAAVVAPDGEVAVVPGVETGSAAVVARDAVAEVVPDSVDGAVQLCVEEPDFAARFDGELKEWTLEWKWRGEQEPGMLRNKMEQTAFQRILYRMKITYLRIYYPYKDFCKSYIT